MNAERSVCCSRFKVSAISNILLLPLLSLLFLLLLLYIIYFAAVGGDRPSAGLATLRKVPCAVWVGNILRIYVMFRE
ncbi:hypothetical protein E2C01_026242 [Portunus trituberculatus]|uniref:Uncharacterized protein n=1 Tax=Portunus trituberculatus TaxID=210409 RepID=A0A5B7EHK4_PORTR|nr:hypothetical protein [Portunus trituberculatus]